jgi:hypothetical protein
MKIKYIPYHKLPLERKYKVTVQYHHIPSPEGGGIAVGRSKGIEGLFFRITNTIGKGRESLLRFRLTDRAAMIMANLITNQIKL